MRVNRFVLDANIWVSYVITRSEHKLIDKVAEGELTIFICEELLVELERVFRYPQLEKYQIDIPAALDLIQDISVKFKLTYPLKRYIPDDPDDDYVVALALQTNSGFITSGDKHILSAKNNLETKFRKLKILSKSEFEKKVLK
jgi:hypothetical protein